MCSRVVAGWVSECCCSGGVGCIDCMEGGLLEGGLPKGGHCCCCCCGGNDVCIL